MEDSPRDTELLRRELTKTFGAVTTEVVDTAAAFSTALHRIRWDVIIADHSLPRFSSTEALRILQETGRDIPFIILSGSMGEERAVAAMKNGASNYLTKQNLGLLGPAVARELRDAEVRCRLAASERERQRQHLEQELLSKRLEIIRRMGNDILLLVAPDGAVAQANDRAVKAYGYAEEELLRLNIRDLRAPETVGDVEEKLQHTLAMDGLRFTTHHRRRDGSTFPVEVSTRSLEMGGKRFVQSFIRDLTEERAARAAVEYQAMLLDNLHDAVIGLDAGMAITAWNLAAERTFGWTGAEVLGRQLVEVVPSEYPDGSSVEEVTAREALAGKFKSEVRRRTRTGEWLDLECISVPLRGPGGAVVGYVSVNRDISLRKRAETALRASQERMQRIFETANEGIAVLDGQGRLEFANPRAGQLLGFEPGQAVGRHLLELFPEELRPTAELDLLAFQRGEAVHREMKLRRPDGSDSFIILSTSTLRAPAGSVEAVVAVFTDVTDQRRAQERFLRAQKMEAVGRLASGIAHDFNNLLVVITSNAQFLAEALPEGDQGRADAEEIGEAGARAVRLIRQLLIFGRKEASNPEPVTLNSVVEGIESLLRRTIGEDIAVSTSLDPAHSRTRIDPGHLEQVLMNLAVNARDAMPHGGKLHIVTRSEEVGPPLPGEAVLTPGRYAVLEMSDTGCGMSPEVVPKVFDPFFTTKEAGKGTGLGLSTVFGIVEQAKGRIALTSEPGRGTTFTIYLPVCEEEERAKPAAGHTRPARGEGETILVAEDDDAVRHVTRRMLERNGFRVVQARSGAEALRRLEAGERVDLIVSDVVMPEGSGHTLAHVVGQLRPGVPVVLVSGYSDPQSALAESGPLLAKPFTEEALIARVHSALSQARRQPALGAAGDADAKPGRGTR